MRKRMRRTWAAVAALSVGGSSLVLEGCDPAARDQILGGVEGGTQALLGSFISAFFATIQARADRQDDPTTVMADIEIPAEKLIFA